MVVGAAWPTLAEESAPRRYGDKVLPDATVEALIGNGIEKGRSAWGGCGRGR